MPEIGREVRQQPLDVLALEDFELDSWLDGDELRGVR